MPRIAYSEQAISDLERLYNFLVQKDLSTAQRALLEIDTSINTQLAQNPTMYREVAGELREYIIEFGKSGYIALFDYNQGTEVVEILAIRHQLEDDYKISLG